MKCWAKTEREEKVPSKQTATNQHPFLRKMLCVHACAAWPQTFKWFGITRGTRAPLVIIRLSFAIDHRLGAHKHTRQSGVWDARVVTVVARVFTLWVGWIGNSGICFQPAKARKARSY